MPRKKPIPKKYQVWIDARKKYHLSHGHIQMARELGLNPKKFGGLANHKQEPCKAPLPVFIEELYFKRFGKTQPDEVRSIEQILAERERKKARRTSRSRSRRKTALPPGRRMDCGSPSNRTLRMMRAARHPSGSLP